MREFSLQIPSESIGSYAARYEYADDHGAVAAGRRASQLGFYERDDFLTVCEWKAKRVEGLFNANTSEAIASATRSALSGPNERAGMEALLALEGVGVPMASALLHFAHPEDYPILDVRALESLGYKSSRTTYSVSFWLEYLSFCRACAREQGVPLRTLDKALWQFSREGSPGRDSGRRWMSLSSRQTRVKTHAGERAGLSRTQRDEQGRTTASNRV